MSTLSMTLTFPHPHLMPIVGTPNNTSLKLLTKNIYANVCAIPSTCGGCGHGYLGLIMPVAEYLIVAGMTFQLPAHPGLITQHALALMPQPDRKTSTSTMPSSRNSTSPQ